MAGGRVELKLLGTWASPFVIRLKLALSFKGLIYESVEEEDLYYNKSELLLKSNPVHKKVPVLLHNGKPVCESQLIVQYIDEAFTTQGPSLLPVQPYERAMARFWAAYIDDKFFASTYRAGSWAKTEEEKAEALKETFEAVEILEAAFKDCSKGKLFFGGDSVGYLDIVLGGLIPLVYYGEARYGIKLFDGTRSPLLEAWVERFGALDAAKAILPEVDKLIENSKANQARAAAMAASASN